MLIFLQKKKIAERVIKDLKSIALEGTQSLKKIGLLSSRKELIILTDCGQMFSIKEDQVKKSIQNNAKIKEKNKISVKDIRQIRKIIDFKVLDSSDSAILFINPKEAVSSPVVKNQYSSCCQIFLSNSERKPHEFEAHGNIKYQMISSNSTGDRILFLKYNKKTLKYKFYVKVNNHSTNEFKIKKLSCSFKSIFQGSITCILFLYSRSLEFQEMVLIADSLGTINLFLLMKSQKGGKTSFSLEHQYTFDKFTKKTGKKDEEFDIMIQAIKTRDNKYIICRMKNSKIHIFHLDKKEKSIRLIRTINLKERLRIISLSKNGRFLFTGGEFPTSFKRLDLFEIDGQTFSGKELHDSALASQFFEKNDYIDQRDLQSLLNQNKRSNKNKGKFLKNIEEKVQTAYKSDDEKNRMKVSNYCQDNVNLEKEKSKKTRKSLKKFRNILSVKQIDIKNLASRDFLKKKCEIYISSDE